MERKIKFRAWSIKEKRFVSVTALCSRYNDLGIGEIVTLDNDGLMLDIGKDIVLMQFTGLKDKSGKDIFEGDILSYNLSKPFDEKSDFKFNYVMSYSELNHWWYLEYIKQKGIDGISGFEGKGQALGKYFRMEVIGNIYENKELMKKRIKK